MARARKAKAAAAQSAAGTLYLRTVDKDRLAHGGFQWPREIGSVVTAPDYSPERECGHGLHGLPWGQGDLSLLSSASDAIWQVVGHVTDPVDIDGSKSKFRSCILLYAGDRGGASPSWRCPASGS